MSLNNIELGELLIAELYRDNLLATDSPPLISRPAATPMISSTVAAAASAKPSEPASPATTSPATTPAAATSASSKPAAAPVPSAITPAPPSPAPGYKFLGNNRRRITVLVQSPGVAFLPDDQLSFLTRMLEACKMNVGDVAIINQANASVTVTALKEQLQPAVILLFGMEPVDIRLPMNFPPFKLQAYDACTYLCAPSLEELVKPGDESKLLKSKLWVCLKNLFEI